MQFGKSSGLGNKEGVYEDVYGSLEKSLASNGPLRGALFWRWSLEGGDDTAVNAGDSVWGCVQGPCSYQHFSKGCVGFCISAFA